VRSVRLAVAAGVFAVAAGLVVFTVMAFLRSNPSTVDFASGHSAGQPVDLTLQTVGSIGFGPHPTWVSYLTKAPDGRWLHTTLWELPAHTKIHVTVYQYDSGGALRNQQIGRVTGTVGDVAYVNGKSISVINSNATIGVAHTFSIPTLGVNVPLLSNPANATLCPAAPCTPKNPHPLIKFTFTTPGPGQYPWQCFLPCGLGFLYGNGGPMQTIGYMDGFLKVVA
jgi:hypothetical protein